MNEEDLAQFEAAIGRTLPLAFRKVMTNFPQELIVGATMTDADGNEIRDCMLINPNAEAILAGIAHYQSEPGWPKEFLVIGENGCGEIYSVDISQEKCPVFESGPHNDAGATYPHQEGYFDEVSEDLEGWVARLVQQTKDRASGINPFEQTQRLLDQSRRQKEP